MVSEVEELTENSRMAGDHFWEIRFSSHLANGHHVVEDFVARAQEWGATQSDALSLRHGLHEAVVNAIRHGNGGDATRQVRVAYRFIGIDVEIEVEDQGHGFCRQSIADPCSDDNVGRPGGRGVMMMRHFMHSVEYNDRGNVVTMRRSCPR